LGDLLPSGPLFGAYFWQFWRHRRFFRNGLLNIVAQAYFWSVVSKYLATLGHFWSSWQINLALPFGQNEVFLGGG